MKLSKVRIKNYRSIKDLDLDLGNNPAFIGRNNSGKSNILKAINYCLSRKNYFDYKSVFSPAKEKKEDVYIDLMFTPSNNKNEFDEYWYPIIGANIMPYNNGDSFCIRTMVKYDLTDREYKTKRFILSDWDNIDSEKGNRIDAQIYTSIQCFYVDSKRDLSQEIRRSNSIFSKLISETTRNLSDKDKEEILKELSEINLKIMDKIPGFSNVEKDLNGIVGTLDKKSSINIVPIVNEIKDIDKGVDVFIDEIGTALPVDHYGDGTRSWLSVLSLKSYIKSKAVNMSVMDTPFFCLVLLEEPESHLHPQAQHSIYSQISGIRNIQTLITCHSGDLVSEFELEDINLVDKKDEQTILKKINIIDEVSKAKIKSNIFEYKSEILFARKVLVVEGHSEKILLPSLYKKLKGKYPFEDGISIVRSDGWSAYKIYANLCSDLDIPMYIYYDLDCKKQMLDSIRKNFSISESNVLFTNKIDLEEELYHYNREICEDYYAFKNELTKTQFEKIKIKRHFTSMVLKLMKEHKSSYPYYFISNIDRLNRLDSFNKVIEKMGGS